MAKIEVYVKYDNSVSGKDETLTIENVGLQGYPLYGRFMGFDENNMPIWEDVTVYQPDNSDYGKSSEMIHANNSMSISSSDGFVLYSDFTHFSYPWKVGYERPGVIDSYFFVELPSGELRWNPDGVEFKAGVVNKIYVTIKSKNLEVSVVHENISSNWWSGSEDDHKYDVSM